MNQPQINNNDCQKLSSSIIGLERPVDTLSLTPAKALSKHHKIAQSRTQDCCYERPTDWLCLTSRKSPLTGGPPSNGLRIKKVWLVDEQAISEVKTEQVQGFPINEPPF